MYVPYILHSFFCNCYTVNGGWSSWRQGTCSKTCGGGIIRFNRICNSPSPKCNGLNCRGISFREETCNEFCCRGKSYDNGSLKMLHLSILNSKIL